MIAFILTIIISLLYARMILTRKEVAVYYFIPYNYLFDLIFFSTSETLAMLSTILRVLILLTFFYQINDKRFFVVSKPSFTVYVLMSVILLLSSLLGGNSIKSLLETIKFILIILSFFSFFIYFSYRSLNEVLLKKMVLTLAIITIVNIGLSNIFSFGWAGYSDNVGFYTGGILSNMWYIPAFVLVATVAVMNLEKRGSNLLLTIASILVLMILIVALRRSAYIILAISILSALLFLKMNLRIIKIGAGILILCAIAAPFFIPILERQLLARDKTFDKGVDEESRLKETEVLWEERLETSPTFVFLLGEKPFNSTGNYGHGSFGDRPLHVDMNIVFFSSGLIGLSLYTLFYINIFIRYFKLSRRFKGKLKKISVFKYLFFSAFFSLIALSFSGGLNALTFRMFGFLLIGIALGQLNYLYKARRSVKMTLNTVS